MIPGIESGRVGKRVSPHCGEIVTGAVEGVFQACALPGRQYVPGREHPPGMGICGAKSALLRW